MKTRTTLTRGLFRIMSGILLLTMYAGCKDFLDVIPDNVATIDNAFTLSTEAEKYLFTCYSYLPPDGEISRDPAVLGGDEYWMDRAFRNFDQTNMQIAMGLQRSTDPYAGLWPNMYKALRDCNIFLDNVRNVPDLEPARMVRWEAEVKFLKAYYHWRLLQMYGPVPVMDKTLPISAELGEIQVPRQPVDSVVNLIVRLIDEAAPGLPIEILNRKEELGRVTRPAALAIKARVLVTAASPLFNGNTDYAGLRNKNDQTDLFNQTADAGKWERAAMACKEAIAACEEAGIELYRFNDPVVQLPDGPLKTQMDIRNSICHRWNSELIWGATQWYGDQTLQRYAMPPLNPNFPDNRSNMGQLAPTLKIAETFYTKNGVPIREDKTWNYAGRYTLKVASDADEPFIQQGFTTAVLHFDREPRFYASVGFDGGRWFMRDGMYTVFNKVGETQGKKGNEGYSSTGFFSKKLVNWNYVIKEKQDISVESYPWPIMRLADLYLMYAEAINEWHGPDADAYNYINKVRERAGLKSVQESWSLFSTQPTKFATQAGFREIVRQERLIELAFEGRRFWDLRRWKTSVEELNQPLMGWDVLQDNPEQYYRTKLLFNQSFRVRENLWPINQNDMLINPNLVQNTGW